MNVTIDISTVLFHLFFIIIIFCILWKKMWKLEKDSILIMITSFLSFSVWLVINVTYKYFKTLHFTFHW